MNKTQRIFRILTKHGYYYATPPSSGRYGRFSEKVELAWLYCEQHARENIPWMSEAELEPRMILTDKMFCNQCDINKKRGK